MFHIGDVVRLRGSGPLAVKMVVYRTAAEATILDRLAGLRAGFVKVQWQGPLGMIHWDIVDENTVEATGEKVTDATTAHP